MMLAKVKEQDEMMLAKVKVPSIPTSAASCDDVQLTNAESSSNILSVTTVNYFIGLRPPNTDTSSYLQPSITSSDCVLLQAADVGYLGLLLLQASSQIILFFYFCKHHPILFLYFCKHHPILFLYFCKHHPILFLYFCKRHPYTF